MQYCTWKKLMIVFMLFCGNTLIGSCGSTEKATLVAEVDIQNESVYVWNRGEEPWTGGTVFLDEQSRNIKKSFGKINPNGFAQLPLREFKQGSKETSGEIPRPEYVWVEVEGYAPKKFVLK